MSFGSNTRPSVAVVGKNGEAIVCFEEALRLNSEHEVDAVVTDVMLPSLKGPALVEELRRHRPQLRALFISGFTSEALVQDGLSLAEVAFVQKPFTGEELTSRLRELLEG